MRGVASQQCSHNQDLNVPGNQGILSNYGLPSGFTVSLLVFQCWRKNGVTIPLASKECILLRYCRIFTFILKHYPTLFLSIGAGRVRGFSHQC